MLKSQLLAFRALVLVRHYATAATTNNRVELFMLSKFSSKLYVRSGGSSKNDFFSIRWHEFFVERTKETRNAQRVISNLSMEARTSVELTMQHASPNRQWKRTSTATIKRSQNSARSEGQSKKLWKLTQVIQTVNQSSCWNSLNFFFHNSVSFFGW